MGNPGARSRKKTRRWVIIADKIADKAITIGGVLVIAAVMTMTVYLIYVVVPLFKGGEVLSVKQYNAPIDPSDIVNLTIDEHGTLAVAVSKTGKVDIWHAGTGTALKSLYFNFGDKHLTSVGKTIDNNSIAFGFSDGTLKLAEIVFRNDIISDDSAPQGLKGLDDQDKTDGDTIFSRIPGKGLRKVDVELDLKPEIRVSESGLPIVALGYRLVEFGDRPKSYLALADSSGEAHFISTETKSNMLTGAKTTEVNKVALPLPGKKVEFKFAVINDMGDQIMLADKQGRVFRYDVGNESEPKLAEVLDLLPSDRELTVFDTLLGGRSIVVGDSLGGLSIYFLIRRDDAQSTDGLTMVRAREFAPLDSSVAGFSASQNGKSFATLDSTGSIWLIHGISQKILLKLGGTTIFARKIALSPRLESLVAIGNDGHVGFWKLSVPHPEISWRTLFGKVWYEGYPSPSFTWQSTGATDAFEPKLSLVPLIFGTLKATFYSLLFAAPLALLAAIYTSEFVPKNVHGKIKPIMEIMASLPSVVLGFVAALVLAPVVESWIGAVILAFVVLPMSLVASAYLWQLIPVRITLRLEGLPKLILMGLSVFLGLSVAYSLGPQFERVFFNGDLKTWLNTNQGSSQPLLFLLALPVAGVALTYAISRTIGPRLNIWLRSFRDPYGPLLDMLRWLFVILATVVISYLSSFLLSWLGLDPRGSIFGTYVQRNTLVVGFAMGFAVIPIIYTLAEDALGAVPDQLRSASLGCGATTWQTAMWVVLPTAISGVFSAIMIGMGRAVGETMIVVMATGNTPVLDLNIFSGLRALSANIAVELPEAPKDGTLYRTLFMTGLVLFAMTFFINTLAEIVRQRFRKKALKL
jgi:phosphate transport system permease protein